MRDFLLVQWLSQVGPPSLAWAEPGDLARSKAVAVVLWLGLAIGLVLFLGIALIVWVSRRARQVTRRRAPVPTEMPDIWFLNPPEKRKPKDR